MQASQPMLPPSPAERAREARAKRRRAMRQYLVVGLCFVGLLCLGAVAVGFLAYDRATKPDLGTPEHVTRKYLEAYLVDRDDYSAKQYQCPDDSGLAEVKALRSDIDNRESKYGVKFNYSVDTANELARTGTDARVGVDLVLSTVIQGQPRREVEHWEFVTHNAGGWRVCRAHETD
jgi:hypothetical protein